MRRVIKVKSQREENIRTRERQCDAVHNPCWKISYLRCGEFISIKGRMCRRKSPSGRCRCWSHRFTCYNVLFKNNIICWNRHIEAKARANKKISKVLGRLMRDRMKKGTRVPKEEGHGQARLGYPNQTGVSGITLSKSPRVPCSSDWLAQHLHGPISVQGEYNHGRQDSLPQVQP